MGKSVVIFTGVDSKLFQRAMGAYQMAHYLRIHGYSVQVVDFVSDFSLDDLRKVADRYVTESTVAIGVSTTFFSQQESKFIAADKSFDTAIPPQLETVILESKAKWPGLRVVFGGSRSMTAVGIPYVDCVVHGYGEDKFLSYLNSIPPTGHQVLISKDPEIKYFDIGESNHAFAPADLIQEGETLPIEVSRGCMFKCKFCAFPMNGKKRLDFLRSPKSVVDEIKYNYEHYGSTNYFIGDDTFNDSTEKVEGLANELAKLPFKIKFTAYLRLDLLNAHREQIPMLYDMGLASPFFGIESLNQRAASAIGKGMDVERVKTFLVDLHDNHWKGELPFTCSFIVGLPGETEDSVRSTFEWAQTSPVNAVFFPLSISVQSFYQSEFQLNYSKYGYVVKDMRTGAWRNDNFTSERATSLAEEFNTKLMYTNDFPSSWFLMTLLSHGLTLEEAKSTSVKDLNWSSLLRSRRRKVDIYKRQLLN